VAVLAPEVCPVSIARSVAVLDPGLRLVHRAYSHVDADVGLGPEHATVLYELVRAEVVGLLHGPRKIHLPRTLLARSYPVGPVVAADEVPTGPAQDRYPQVFRGFENVTPVASFVAQGRVLVEDAAVDTTDKVLDEPPEDSSVQPADPTVEVELNPCNPSLLSGSRFASNSCLCTARDGPAAERVSASSSDLRARALGIHLRRRGSAASSVRMIGVFQFLSQEAPTLLSR
jgi:hypothetical protein